jgi:hypothetical protein
VAGVLTRSSRPIASLSLPNGAALITAAIVRLAATGVLLLAWSAAMPAPEGRRRERPYGVSLCVVLLPLLRPDALAGPARRRSPRLAGSAFPGVRAVALSRSPLLRGAKSWPPGFMANRLLVNNGMVDSMVERPAPILRFGGVGFQTLAQSRACLFRIAAV